MLAWQDYGVGDVCVLFLHGFPFDSGLWTPQLEALPAGWRGVAPDLRGFGGSRALELPESLTMDGHARDVLALLDHLDIGRAVVCGLSMGGYIALALHRLAPERVRALVLADTRAEPDSAEAREQRYTAAASVAEHGTGEFIEGMLGKLLAPGSPSDTVRAMMERAPAATVAASLRGLAERPDARPHLPEIAVPTLVIGGELDQITPPASLRALADGIPGAELVLIPGVGHVSNLEAPAAFNEALFGLREPAAR